MRNLGHRSTISFVAGLALFFLIGLLSALVVDSPLRTFAKSHQVEITLVVKNPELFSLNDERILLQDFAEHFGDVLGHKALDVTPTLGGYLISGSWNEESVTEMNSDRLTRDELSNSVETYLADHFRIAGKIDATDVGYSTSEEEGVEMTVDWPRGILAGLMMAALFSVGVLGVQIIRKTDA